MHNALSKTAPLVDCHFHVFAAQSAVAGARYQPAYEASLASWMQAASGNGIGRGVLVQTSFMGTDNCALLAALSAAGERLRGVAVLNLSTDAAQLPLLHRQGVRGIRLNLLGRNHDVSAWGVEAGVMWEALAALGWHVEIHTDTGALPTVLAHIPAALPVVLDHFARPDQASAHDATVRAVVARARSSAVHIKLSGAYRLGAVSPKELARIWLQELGPEQLLWGSDWPCTNHESQANYPALFAALHGWVDSEAQDQQILQSNPQRLYWGGPGG